MKRTLLFCAIAMAALTVQSAKADSFFSVSFDGGSLGYSGSGIFVGSEASSGIFDITGVLSGTVTDPGFGSSSIVNVSDYAGSDNLLYYPNGGQNFDFNGLAFTLANGVNINLFTDVEGDTVLKEALQSNPAGDIPEFVTSTVVATTPEPSSFILVGTSLIGAAGFLRRRFLA